MENSAQTVNKDLIKDQTQEPKAMRQPWSPLQHHAAQREANSDANARLCNDF